MKISFVVVARNAGKTIETLFACLDGQDYPHSRMELILVDGLSEDGTRQLMEAYAARCDFARALVLDNPGRTLP
ncbi:MAG: glycosyltransferase, partial [Oscillospiraceae bacterium]|nr:glycosyltransferase [Oscillospiraceae bacterium]